MTLTVRKASPAEVYERRAGLVRENRERPRFCEAPRGDGECGCRLAADHRRRVCEACKRAGRRARPRKTNATANARERSDRVGYAFLPGLKPLVSGYGEIRRAARATGADENTMRRYVSLRYRCPPDLQERLAGHLGVPLGELLGGAD